MKATSKFVGSLVCAAAFVLAASQASAANLVLNPGFETGTTADWLVLNSGTVTVVADNGPAAPGTFSVFMQNTLAANNLALQQSTALGSATPGTVNYSFDLKVDSSLNGGVVFIHFWDINSTGGVIDQGPGLKGPYFNTGWQTYTGSWTAPANVDHFEVEFDCTTGATAGSVESIQIDNVSISQVVVPEPTTLSLVGLGLLGALMVRRSRKA
jgi:PEP-CTERM motif